MKNNKVVYIVSWGDYADYSIDGVNSSFKKAIEVIQEAKDNNRYDWDTMRIIVCGVNEREDYKQFNVEDLNEKGLLK